MRPFQVAGWPRQRGQALAFTTAIAAVVMVCFIVVFNIGQLGATKIRMQNAADGAAYSAALAEARDFNFQAYMNRAVIANQVAVGQLIAMNSWFRYWNDTFTNEFYPIAETLASISPVGNIMWNSAQVSWIAPLAKGSAKASDSITKVLVPILDNFIIDPLRWAGKIYHWVTLVNLGLAVAGDVFSSAGLDVLEDMNPIGSVMKANDPNAALSLMGYGMIAYHAYLLNKFVTNFDPAQAQTTGKKKDFDRMAAVQDASMDGFYHNRSYGPMILPVLFDPTVLFIPFNNGMLFMQYTFHAGGTEMKDHGSDKNRKLQGVAGADAAGLFGIFVFWILAFIVPIPIPIPIFLPGGSGGSFAGNNAFKPEYDMLSPDNNYKDGRWDAYGGLSGPWAFPTMFGGDLRAAKGPGPNGNSPVNHHTGAGLRPYNEVAANVNPQPSSTNANKGKGGGAGGSDPDPTGPRQADPSNADEAQRHLNDQGPVLAIEIERRHNSITLSDSEGWEIGGGPGGQLDLGTSGTKSQDSMRALASAQAYFKRPNDLAAFQRGDGKVEYGSFYSPYWQPRLVSNSLLYQIGTLGGKAIDALF